MSDLLVGIDLGSTTSRCVVFNPDGQEFAAAYREVPVDYPRPSWAEVPPERWWQAISAVTREAVSRVDAGAIRGVGISGLMHAPILLGADDQPLAPAMLWMDQRCAAQAAAIGTPTTVSAPKLRWISEHQPELLARAKGFVLSKDFVRIKLTGVGGTDTSDAGGTGLWDRAQNAWLPDALDRARIAASQLPTTRLAHTLAGHVTAAAAAQTGLRVGTPVAVGGSDVHCCRIGVGPLHDDDICLYMGTAAWMSFGRRGFGGSTATTGAALRWTRDLLGAATYDDALAGADAIAPGAEGLTFLTHLNGERGPTPEPRARGALIGLTLRHSRAHVARATLEGTALQIRRNFDERWHGEVRRGVVSGGASRSPLWMQILVDVTGVPLRVPEHSESSVLGAALLGGAAAGLFTVEEGQRRMCRAGRTYEPDSATHARYDPVYRAYCELDAMLMPWFRENTTE